MGRQREQRGGLIEASYAIASVGGDGDEDLVGGLVGRQEGSSITASYATGAAVGGAGDDDSVGRLVGRQEGGLITASYGFGEATGETQGSDGSAKPAGVSMAAQLTAANAGSSWNDAGSNTLGVWDFGTDGQLPALKYADHDGPGVAFDCSQLPSCDTLLAGQRDDGSGSGTDGGSLSLWWALVVAALSFRARFKSALSALGSAVLVTLARSLRRRLKTMASMSSAQPASERASSV